MFTIIKNERGAVLVISLMILALLTVLSLTAMLTTTTDMEISTNYKVSQNTFYNTEGSMDIAPGPIRRTISLKTESPDILASLGISDSDGDGISATDAASPFSGLTTDADGDGMADFTESIMGFVSTAPPDFTIQVDLDNSGAVDLDEIKTTVTTTRTGPTQLKGFSTGFATGYEGGAMTGRGIDFSMSGTATGERNSTSGVQLVYRCIERSGGGCL
jgi:hypothetical protein